jgi:hypothetical protein
LFHAHGVVGCSKMSVSKDKDGLLFVGKSTDISKDGVAKVKKWKQKWLVICGSSLYYYNKKTVCDCFVALECALTVTIELRPSRSY